MLTLPIPAPSLDLGTARDLYTLAARMRAYCHYEYADRVTAAAEAMARMEEFCNERVAGDAMPLAAMLRQTTGCVPALSVVWSR